jgi:hypothetical protein
MAGGKPRPKVVESVREAAKEYGGEAIERLAYWMRQNHPTASPLAAKELIDRGFGKSVQRNEHTGADGGPIQTQTVEDQRPPIETFLGEFTKEKSGDTKH